MKRNWRNALLDDVQSKKAGFSLMPIVIFEEKGKMLSSWSFRAFRISQEFALI
jgi:hypothetical protein